MSTRDVFPIRLQAIRQQRGMTQAQLAKAAELQQPAIAQFENGTRTPSGVNLARLAKALDATTDYLLGLDDQVVDMGSPAAAAVTRIVRDLPDEEAELLKEIAEAVHKRAKAGKGNRSRKK